MVTDFGWLLLRDANQTILILKTLSNYNPNKPNCIWMFFKFTSDIFANFSASRQHHLHLKFLYDFGRYDYGSNGTMYYILVRFACLLNFSKIRTIAAWI